MNDYMNPGTSRRSVLGGGALLTLSAATATAFAATAAAAPRAGHLRFDYKPSQVTGWSPPYSPTLGGHIPSKDFTWHGKTYRVSVLLFGAAGPVPVYEPVPADPTVKFTRTVARKWGKYYTFRYQGGLAPAAAFTIESYGAFQGPPPNPRQSGVLVGADLYAVYDPGTSRSHPTASADPQFIQVAYFRIGTGQGDNLVDTDRANPFYGEGGGLTSINGRQSISFSDFVRQGYDDEELPPNYFIAETFLAEDTRKKDAAGKDIVNIFGGLKWGWQLRALS
jgi:hypothetical protein